MVLTRHDLTWSNTQKGAEVAALLDTSELGNVVCKGDGGPVVRIVFVESVKSLHCVLGQLPRNTLKILFDVLRIRLCDRKRMEWSEVECDGSDTCVVDGGRAR